MCYCSYHGSGMILYDAQEQHMDSHIMPVDASFRLSLARLRIIVGSICRTMKGVRRRGGGEASTA